MEQINPLVSVLCLTYNHEKYIRSALEGFVQQKTNFPFEVLVHDDASTDGTARIIAEYAEKYPEIIIPIYQKENQYQKRVQIHEVFIYPKIRGKYIAICEGDDYWCDEQKLQRQADWMEAHEDYAFCVHNTEMVDCTTGLRTLINQSNEEYDIPFEKIIERGSAYFQTSSFFYRKEYFFVPPLFSIGGPTDYPTAIYLATCGKVHYYPQVMSVYRYQVEGSYSWRMLHNEDSLKAEEKEWNEIKQMLQRVDEYTNNQYSETIQQIIRKRDFKFLVDNGKFREIKENYPDLYEQLTDKEKIKIQIIRFLPHIISIYRRTRIRYQNKSTVNI